MKTPNDKSTASDAEPCARGPGRPRCEQARKSVLEATRALLREVSYDELAMDGVAARSGVPKSTIYRHWPSKAALAVEAFLELVAERVEVTAGPDFRSSIERQLLSLCRLQRLETGRFFRSVVAAAQGDEEVRAALWDGFIARRRAVTAEQARAAEAAGEVGPGRDVEVLLDLLYGPIVYRLLLTGKAPSDAAVRQQVAWVFDGAAARGSASK